MRIPKAGAFVMLPLLAAAFGSLIDPALAGEAAVRAKVKTLCENCHGEYGVAVMPGAANLSGQQKEYLREQLRAYRSGRRQSPHMSVVAKSLTDDDIESLSEWYSSIKITVEKPK
ncbi:MAG: cytochrome c [Gammaproteobacteria bacterium]|nr:cytochrome c [Gammaproteobacteria bacterium]MDH3413740.1 cytochrome c [Gammaproteobacteria bacterium]